MMNTRGGWDARTRDLASSVPWRVRTRGENGKCTKRIVLARRRERARTRVTPMAARFGPRFGVCPDGATSTRGRKDVSEIFRTSFGHLLGLCVGWVK